MRLGHQHLSSWDRSRVPCRALCSPPHRPLASLQSWGHQIRTLGRRPTREPCSWTAAVKWELGRAARLSRSCQDPCCVFQSDFKPAARCEAGGPR